MSRSTTENVQIKIGSSNLSASGMNKNVQSSEVSSSGGSKNGSRPHPKDRSVTTNIVLDDSSDDDNAEKIRVGKQYQSTCPDLLTGVQSKALETLDEKATLVWTPTSTIDDNQIDEYVRTAQEKYGYNMEQALGMLYWHTYDLKSAMEDLCNFMPYPDEWTAEDKVLFEQAFQFHGKSFNRIRQMLPDKSVGSLVKYYYSWKKTRTKTSVMDRQEQVQAKNGNSDNSSERDSNENSDADDKTQQVGKQLGEIVTTTPPEPVASTSSSINNCTGCGVACTEVHNTVHGKLCSSCHHHYKRTGILRPISAPNFFGKRSRPNDNGKYKKYPPKGIYFNHDDIVALAQASQNPEQNKQHDIVIGMERECASHWTRIQSNKQKLSKIRAHVEAALPGFQAPDSNNRVSVRWTNDEYLLAVQGVRNHGKDFATIANILGTKTEAQIRTFFVNYRRRYDLDKLVREHEAKHGRPKLNTSAGSGKETSKSGKEHQTNQPETTLPPVEIDLDEENTNVNANNEDVTMTAVSQ